MPKSNSTPAVDRFAWMDQAACRPGTGVDPRIFDTIPAPSKKETKAERETRRELNKVRAAKAKKICGRCPVTNACYESAFGTGSMPTGIRGGFDFSNTGEDDAEEVLAA